MPVNLKPCRNLQSVGGIRLATAAAGIKYADRTDLALLELAPGSQTTAVFTRNAFKAAPVVVSQRHLNTSRPRYLLINSGNANAGLGKQGIEDARACCEAVAQLARCAAIEVLPFSTGVISERLPVDKVSAALPSLTENLSSTAWQAAAEAIMTTDTMPKGISGRTSVDGESVVITGIAKGSGMIKPDMATMLAFVATDAAAPADLLRDMLNEAVARSFNMISVDGDTSTNDACVLIATGQAGADLATSPDQAAFRAALIEVMQFLAEAIVRDGEGATKFIRIKVQTAASAAEARSVAETIAHSPLVKTAFFASDPNLGRILAAVGRADVQDFDIARVTISLDDVCIVRDGSLAEEYTEAAGQRVMAQPEITIRVELGRGVAEAGLWTCDLSYDYVKINAEYRS
ncbi:MAG: bifunctional glutamate N-acetyltransferase/amino-acid acetyltransferase ArgJ [Gammaproteobacteria bacterium]